MNRFLIKNKHVYYGMSKKPVKNRLVSLCKNKERNYVL